MNAMLAIIAALCLPFAAIGLVAIKRFPTSWVASWVAICAGIANSFIGAFLLMAPKSPEASTFVLAYVEGKGLAMLTAAMVVGIAHGYYRRTPQSPS